MRKTLLALLLSVAVVSPALADPPDEDVLRPRLEGDSRWFVELDPGLNISLLDGNPYMRPLITSYEQETSIYRSALGLGPYLGLSVGYEFSSHIGITLHAAYDARHTSNSGSMIDTCVMLDPVSGNQMRNPMQVEKSYAVNASYLSFALLPNYRFERLFFFLGPAVSIPLSGRIEETNTIVDDSPCYYLAPSDDTAKSITGSITDVDNFKTRISLKAGIGYIFNITPNIDIVPQLALDLGLNSVLQENDLLRLRNAERPATSTSLDIPVNAGMRINTLQAIIGIRFHL